jgi:NAD(P)-dependent dehydrogenase (short-subunit alcohol dehydrogenase family)
MPSPYSLFDLSKDVAVVIGGTGVLGGALASGLGLAGAKVAILGRSKDRGESRAHQIREAGGKAVFIACDAQDPASLKAAHAEVIVALGHPSVLVNAAGGNDPKVTVVGATKFEDVKLADWKANYDLNLVGGSIINIASVSAHLPLSRVIAYSAAKAAVLSLTKFLAREWAKTGVRVNSITPGFFPAEQNRKLLFKDDGSPTERAQQILGHTPMARFGKDQELVGAVIFLASQEAASFVTGSDIVVDGGFLSQTI